MSQQEFIVNQTEGTSDRFSPEQFFQLTEMENSIIILKMPFKDYTLTEIARIVEDNNAYILALSTVPVDDGTSLLVSIKLNVSEITALLRGFERFDYNVVYYYVKEGEVSDSHKERLDELLYYLNM